MLHHRGRHHSRSRLIPHFHGGDQVSFIMKLNEPSPEGARFDVRFHRLASIKNWLFLPENRTIVIEKNFL
jgi:hypothetical protein